MIHIYLWKKQKIFVIFILKSNRNQEENTMSYENVKHYFDQIGMGQRVMNLKQLDVSHVKSQKQCLFW